MRAAFMERPGKTLMTYPDKPLEGRVDSLGWGISQDGGSTRLSGTAPAPVMPRRDLRWSG